MPTYLVEAYAANRGDTFPAAREHALRAAALSPDVRFVRTTFVPQDELALHIFQAPSPRAFRRAAAEAALAYERIVEAVERRGDDA